MGNSTPKDAELIGDGKTTQQGKIQMRKASFPKSLQSLFDRFWSAYPRKVSKGKAEKAFIAIDPDEQL